METKPRICALFFLLIQALPSAFATEPFFEPSTDEVVKKGDAACLKRILGALHEPNIQLLLDADRQKDTTVFYWGKFRQALEVTPDETLNSLFNPKKPGGISFKD